MRREPRPHGSSLPGGNALHGRGRSARRAPGGQTLPREEDERQPRAREQRREHPERRRRARHARHRSGDERPRYRSRLSERAAQRLQLSAQVDRHDVERIRRHGAHRHAAGEPHEHEHGSQRQHVVRERNEDERGARDEGRRRGNPLAPELVRDEPGGQDDCERCDGVHGEQQPGHRGTVGQLVLHVERQHRVRHLRPREHPERGDEQDEVGEPEVGVYLLEGGEVEHGAVALRPFDPHALVDSRQDEYHRADPREDQEQSPHAHGLDEEPAYRRAERHPSAADAHQRAQRPAPVLRPHHLRRRDLPPEHPHVLSEAPHDLRAQEQHEVLRGGSAQEADRGDERADHHRRLRPPPIDDRARGDERDELAHLLDGDHLHGERGGDGVRLRQGGQRRDEHPLADHHQQGRDVDVERAAPEPAGREHGSHREA